MACFGPHLVTNGIHSKLLNIPVGKNLVEAIKDLFKISRTSTVVVQEYHRIFDDFVDIEDAEDYIPKDKYCKLRVLIEKENKENNENDHCVAEDKGYDKDDKESKTVEPLNKR